MPTPLRRVDNRVAAKWEKTDSWLMENSDFPVDDALARATTLPAAWYGRDPDIWKRERQAIFGREWLLFGRADEVPDPGSYLADEIAGTPVFVIRDRDGVLRAFHNVCRHRAGPILWDGAGQCDALRCRYHGWVYDTQGALRRTPEFGDATDFDKAEFGLFPVQAGIWRGLIFVNLDPAAKPLDQAMAALSAETAAFDIEGYSFHSRAEHEIACNWKTYVDNYAEGYHVRDIHPGLDREIVSKQYEVVLKTGHAVHRAPQRDGANYAGLWLWRWPNLGLNIYPTGMNIERMVPLGPHRTKLIYNFFFQDISPAAEPAIEAAMAATLAVTNEDKRICEAVQRNLDISLYDTGRLSPRHENGVWYFQKRVREAVEALKCLAASVDNPINDLIPVGRSPRIIQSGVLITGTAQPAPIGGRVKAVRQRSADHHDNMAMQRIRNRLVFPFQPRDDEPAIGGFGPRRSGHRRRLSRAQRQSHRRCHSPCRSA